MGFSRSKEFFGEKKNRENLQNDILKMYCDLFNYDMNKLTNKGKESFFELLKDLPLNKLKKIWSELYDIAYLK